MEKRDDTVKAYEDHMVAQRKLIGTFKLKEMEDDDKTVDSTELEAAKLAAGETPTFEATHLRRSAELRIEAKFGSLKERRAKRLIRDEVLNNTLQNVESIEKSSLQRAQNVSGEVESLLASIKTTVEALASDDEESLDKDDNGKKITTNDQVSSTPDTLEFTFIEEGHDDDDHDEGDSDSEHANQNTEQKEDETAPEGNGPGGVKRSSPKSRAEASARLQALRAKRQSSPRHTVHNNGSPQHVTAVGKQSPGRRPDLLERARSARSARLRAKEHGEPGHSEGKEGHMEQIQDQATGTGENSFVHRRVPDARLAELRERRRNRTAAETEGGT
jgi:hypothetical protein